MVSNHPIIRVPKLLLLCALSLLPVVTKSFTLLLSSSSLKSSLTSAPFTTTKFHAITVTNGEVTGTVKEALKKMRGPSISVEFCNTVTSTNNGKESTSQLTNMELEMLSQELRKAKVGSIFTCDLNAIQEFSKEQQSARGSFPGPCPIIFNGGVDGINDAIEKGASAVVVHAMELSVLVQDMKLPLLKADIICQVETMEHVKMAIERGFEYAFLLSNKSTLKPDDNVIVNETISDILSMIPKEAIVIYSIDAMQKNSLEITYGKQILGLSSSGAESGCKINGLLVNNACVGDDEDVKYTSFVVTNLTKKASSTFAMTGLTGSTNGHFGTMSDNASVENAKWKRYKEK